MNDSTIIRFLEIGRRADWFSSKAGQRYKESTDLKIRGEKSKKMTNFEKKVRSI